jgi:inosine-uridine nucleoside N-ribohydrolase
VVIDTDMGIDDVRAIAAVIPNRDVRAIVVTQGVGDPRTSATALAKVLATPGGQRIPVIVGASAAGGSPLEKLDWLPLQRELSATANGYLKTPVAGPAYSRRAMVEAVRSAVAGCPSIEALLIAPLTSFVRYSPVIRDRLTKAVLQGAPLEKAATTPTADDSFNCAYDLTSCALAVRQLAGLHPQWVDLRYDREPFTLTPDAVAALRGVGLPGAVRAVLEATPSTWLPAPTPTLGSPLMWDDAAALYLLDPTGFTSGRVARPAFSAQALRQRWVDAVNGR